MKKNGISHIRKWLLLYLAMVILTMAVLYLVTYIEVTSALSAWPLDQVADRHSNASKIPPALFAGMQLRLLLIFSTGLIVCMLLGYVWLGVATRNLGRPVRTISQAIAKLAKGQLNDTVDIETSDEFERIGASINELAANLQELLLYVWKQTGQCLTLIEQIHANPDFRHDKRLTLESLGYLKQLAESIDDLRDMAKAYVFYDVSIEGTQTKAIDELGYTQPEEKLPNDMNC